MISWIFRPASKKSCRLSKPMNVKNRTPKVSKTFFDGQFEEMIRDDVKAKGWSTFAESPYEEYKRRVNNAKRIESKSDKKDS